MAEVQGPYAPVDVLGTEYLVPVPWWLPLAGLVVFVGIIAVAVGIAWASPQQSEGQEVQSFRAVQELSVMTNHETIRWRDRRGRLHVIEVDREVKMNE